MPVKKDLPYQPSSLLQHPQKTELQFPVIGWFQLSTATSCFFFAAPTPVFRQTQ